MKSKLAGPAPSTESVNGAGRWLGTRSRRKVQGFGAVLVAAGMAATSLTALGGAAPALAASSPKYGGTLRLVGQGDVDFMDTADAYYDVTWGLFRAITRQLYTWPLAPTFAGQVNPVPDLATGMPVITNGGKTYTITIRTGAMWDTSPPRQVTAQDEITGMKRLCNPASPAGALGYYQATIVGFQSYCNAFLATGSKKSGATVSGMDDFMSSHNIAGIKAVNNLTLQFDLISPAADFLDILSLDFASPVPQEELAYVPGSAQLGQHFVSDGPYTISKYVPTRSIDLVRDPAWKASTDPIRKAYVDQIDITEGVATNTAALQEVQAGTEDMFWDQNVPTVQLAGMVASHDPDLTIGPDGNNYIVMNPYLSINLQSPNNHGALKKLLVRQALEYAVNKYADSQVYGGSVISGITNQAIPPGSIGYIPGYDPYPTANGQGNAAKSKQLLAEAGYKPGQITLKLVYRTNTVHPQIAQNDQASLEAGGFNVQLVPVTPPNAFYTKYLENPAAGKSGAWDIVEAGWIPDWMGLNGRSVLFPLLDGSTYGPESNDYGDFNSKIVNNYISEALAAPTQAQAATYWQDANREVMSLAAIVPIGAQKTSVYHSSRVQNAEFWYVSEEYDLTNVWLSS
jgi:ABC-type transport system substrate-binding protein